MSFTAVSNHRNTQLQELITTNQVTAVYQYNVIEVKTGPYISIFPLEGQEQVRTTFENDNNYLFLIKLVSNNIKDESASEIDMLDIADRVFDILRKNSIYSYTGGKCHKSEFTYQRGRNDTQYRTRVLDIRVSNFILNNIQ